MKLRNIAAAASLGIAAAFISGCMSQQERAALLSGPYSVQVDYSQSVESLLKAGKYSWVHYQVTSSNFAGTEAGQGTISAVLVPFSPQANMDYVLSGPAAGMRPATLKELLAFGESYPDVQRKLPVLAMGSSARLEVPTYRKETDNRAGMLPLIVVTRKVEQLYPVLADGLPGRTVNLEWLDDPEGYATYYALFVKQK